MAVERQLDDENNQPQLGSGTASPASGGPGPVAPVGGNKAPQGSGRFFDIRKYINANQGDPGNISSRLQSKIGQTSQKTQSQINRGLGDFNTQIQSEKDRLANANNNITQAVNAAVAPAKGQPAPAPAINPAQFQDYYNARAYGPNQLVNSDQIGQQVQNVQNLAQKTGSEQGRFGLLQNYFGGPRTSSYSTGQQRLDQLLLQSTPGSSAGLQKVANQNAQTVSGALTDAQGNVTQTLNDLNQQRLAAQDLAKTSLSGAQTDIQGNIETELANQNKYRNDLYTELQNRLSGKSTGPNTLLTADALTQLGYDPSTRLYGYTPTLRSQDELPMTLTKEQVAKKEQRDALQNLAQLTGQDQSYLGQLSDAGTFNPFAQTQENISGQAQAARSVLMDKDNIKSGQFRQFLPAGAVQEDPNSPVSINDIKSSLPAFQQRYNEYVRNYGTGSRYAQEAAADIARANDLIKNFDTKQRTLADLLGINVPKPGDLEGGGGFQVR